MPNQLPQKHSLPTTDRFGWEAATLELKIEAATSPHRTSRHRAGGTGKSLMIALFKAFFTPLLER